MLTAPIITLRLSLRLGYIFLIPAAAFMLLCNINANEDVTVNLITFLAFLFLCVADCCLNISSGHRCGHVDCKYISSKRMKFCAICGKENIYL